MSVEAFLQQAKEADQAGDFNKMVECMKNVARVKPALNLEERNMVHVAYKGATGQRREKLRQAPGDQAAAADVQNVCTDLVTLLEGTLIPAAQPGEAQLFLQKLKGDGHRYHYEVSRSADQREKALSAYTVAYDGASRDLPLSHPLRLMIAMNTGVFYYETLEDKQQGLQLTRGAFEEGMAEWDRLDEEGKRESGMMLSFLRDNICIWSDEMGVPRPESVNPPPPERQE